jgi:hypothetical protein
VVVDLVVIILPLAVSPRLHPAELIRETAAVMEVQVVQVKVPVQEVEVGAQVVIQVPAVPAVMERMLLNQKPDSRQ